ncbi:Hypothetical predicted protein, partial [Pelobates cultripes]
MAGARDKATGATTTCNNTAKMADAERAPDKMKDNPDILARLDRIFNYFWHKL